MATSELTSKYKLLLSLSSRFYRKNVLQDENGVEFLATYYPNTYEYSQNDLYHQVTAGDENRLDLISYRYYNTPLLWWIIAEANEIFHPLKEIKAGLVLRIPAPDYVFGGIIK